MWAPAFSTLLGHILVLLWELFHAQLMPKVLLERSWELGNSLIPNGIQGFGQVGAGWFLGREGVGRCPSHISFLVDPFFALGSN